jgi:hypothetical protein
MSARTDRATIVVTADCAKFYLAVERLCAAYIKQDMAAIALHSVMVQRLHNKYPAGAFQEQMKEAYDA